jgi:hypothetical protein
MNRAAFFCLGTIVMVGACRDERAITKPAQPSFALSDGSNGGNPHFFFLPPIVGQPSFSGTFNAHLAPVVQICQIDGGGNCVGPTFSPGVVQLNGSAQQYQVNWNTDPSTLVPGVVYRLSVSVAGQPLGFADVEPVSSGSQLKNLKTGDVFGLLDGRTLPLKFRIELGAFGTKCVSDCAEATVTNDGATVVTNTGFAGVVLPAGWLASPSQVIVTIERVTTIDAATINDAGSNRCIPLAVSVAPQQFEGCYRFKTLPTATFAKFVTVGVCIPVTGLNEADLDAIQLYSVEEPVGEVPEIRALPNAPAPFVSCEGFTSTPLSTGLLRGLPGRLLQPLVQLVAPRKAYAFHLGAGGSTCCFSRIGWVLPESELINFDVDPSGEAIAAGNAVNTAYSNEGLINDVTVGVTFSRTTPNAFCGDANVYANTNGPLPGGGFGFNSGNNVVTICPLLTASDFSENSGGRIVASFTGTVPQACIQVYATGFQSETGKLPGATGFLEAFDVNGVSLGKTTSDPNAFGQNVCVSATATATIASVQFAGSGDGFAMFDNMTVRFSQAPPPILPGSIE